MNIEVETEEEGEGVWVKRDERRMGKPPELPDCLGGPESG